MFKSLLIIVLLCMPQFSSPGRNQSKKIETREQKIFTNKIQKSQRTKKKSTQTKQNALSPIKAHIINDLNISLNLVATAEEHIRLFFSSHTCPEHNLIPKAINNLSIAFQHQCCVKILMSTIEDYTPEENTLLWRLMDSLINLTKLEIDIIQNHNLAQCIDTLLSSFATHKEAIVDVHESIALEKLLISSPKTLSHEKNVVTTHNHVQALPPLRLPGLPHNPEIFIKK